MPRARNTGRPQSGPEERPSRAGAARLSLYLRCLEGWLREGVATVSSGQIAESLGISDAQVRKDVSYVGSLGQPGVGYQVTDLIEAIRQALGINREWRSVLIGVGNLARALLRYQGFRAQGFRIVALFDSDPAKIGQEVEGLKVDALEHLGDKIMTLGAELAILTVPAESAQPVAERLHEAGIRGILNFAPTVLRLPESVRLVNVDLSIQLEQLAFQVQLHNMP
ncbi:MAG: redox-sensing transcriptional repressor Rex [Planctomycetes bacterium]|nr:redox-sensing transcriptional repressor Rex [Planctomycetota bacterium]